MTLWSDNETAIDLLGFDHLSNAVISIVRDESLLPTTIGVFGDWGSGKSSLLELVRNELAKDEDTLVLSFNGWLFEGYEDSKTALIGTIVDEISDHRTFGPRVRDLSLKLLRRINVLRLLAGVSKHAIAFAAAGPAGVGLTAGSELLALAREAAGKADEVDVESAEKLIKDDPGHALRRTVREFRKDFTNLLKKTGIKRLVVIIDDLDRCLPDTIIETLEAIKLFLFVSGTAFILGADERLVKYAVRRRFPELPGDNVEVGRDYLEKLVQFPVRIPPLDRAELETYVNLLFASKAPLLPGEFEKARGRAVRCDAPFFLGVKFNQGIATDIFKEVPKELIEDLTLAQRIAPVLTAGLSGNPRQCKRFLNTLMMRLGMAKTKQVELRQRVLAKLMLLEYFKPEWFRRLAELQMAQDGRPTVLLQLERHVAQTEEAAANVILDSAQSSASKKPAASAASRTGRRTKSAESGEEDAGSMPSGDVVTGEFLSWVADSWMRDWLTSEPTFADIDLRPYFFFSRDTLGPLGGAVRRMTPRAQDCLNRLLQESDAVRQGVLATAGDLSPADAAAVFEALSVRVGQEEDLGAEESPLTRIFEWADVRPELKGQLVALVSRLPESSVPVQAVPRLMRSTLGTEAEAAAKQLLGRWTGSSVSNVATVAKQVQSRL